MITSLMDGEIILPTKLNLLNLYYRVILVYLPHKDMVLPCSPVPKARVSLQHAQPELCAHVSWRLRDSLSNLKVDLHPIFLPDL